MSWINWNSSLKSLSLYIVAFLLMAILVLILWIPVFWGIRTIALPFRNSNFTDARINLPNAIQYKSPKKFFSEQARLKYLPRSFLMFEPMLTHESQINIVSLFGERARMSSGHNENADSWFFGGSAMFGDSSPDNDTIPSRYSELSGKSVINFGVSAYSSRHSLIKLMNLKNAATFKPQNVFFYDGVNNAVANCFTTLDYVPQGYREDLLIDKFEMSGNPKVTYWGEIFSRPFLFLKRLAHNLGMGFDIEEVSKVGNKCADDGQIKFSRLKSIAASQCDDWFYAKNISKSIGAEFYGVLQPQLWSNPDHKKGHLMKAESEYMQSEIYNGYYKVVRQFCSKKLGDSFIDLSLALDNQDFYFVDSVHLSPKGNLIVAEKLFKAVSH